MIQQPTKDETEALARELLIVAKDGKHNTATDARNAMIDYLVRKLFHRKLEGLCVRLYGLVWKQVRSYEERVRLFADEIDRFFTGETKEENWGERL